MLTLQSIRISVAFGPVAVGCGLMEAAVQILAILGCLALRTDERTILVDLSKVGGAERFVEQVLVALVLGIVLGVRRIAVAHVCISTHLGVRLIGLVETA